MKEVLLRIAVSLTALLLGFAAVATLYALFWLYAQFFVENV
jgi:hypothetical protein